MFEFLNGSVFPFSESSTDEPNIGGFEMTEEDDAMMEAFEEIPCTEDNIDDAMMRIALESVENYHMIVEAIMMDEFNEYVATNEEVVYEEGRIKKVTGAIVTFIQNAWQKIKGVFTKLFDTIANSIKNDEKFIKDNEKAIKKFSGELELKGYKYQNLSADPYSRIMDKFESETDDIMADAGKSLDLNSDDIGKIKKSDMNKISKITQKLPDILRGAAIGSEKCTAGEFNKELKKYFAGSDEKSTIKLTPTEVIDEIKSGKIIKANAKASYDGLKRYFNSMIKEAKATEKKAIDLSSKKTVKENNIAACVGAFNSACKNAVNIATIVMRVHVSAINANHRQARAAAAEMARKGGSSSSKKKSTNESALDLIQLF